MATAHYQRVIEKLDGQKNWIIWSRKIKLVLAEQGLWKLVDGSGKIPEEKDEREIWETKNLKALATISLNVINNLS
jgi:hypothetical protein